MKKLFLFMALFFVSFSIANAESKVVVEKVVPVYDKESSVIVTQTDDKNSVVFNDKDQEVKYNVVLKNSSGGDLTVDNVGLTTPSEDFLNYKVTGLNKGDVLKKGESKEIIVTLKTVKQEGWGRNFKDNLSATIVFEDNSINPDTADIIFVVLIFLVGTAIFLILLKNRRVERYTVPFILFGLLFSIVEAENAIVLDFKTDVSYKSQNVMKPSGWEVDVNNGSIIKLGDYHWQYSSQIKNVYIENELQEKTGYIHKFDVSDKQNGKVIAYLVGSSEGISCLDYEDNEVDCFDLYLQADGVIYPNNNMDCYFALLTNLSKIENLAGLDTSEVTSMMGVFGYASTIDESFTLDVSSFDTSNVTDMSYMFYRTGYNSENFNLDVSNFDTSKVTDMSGMFMYAGFYSDFYTLELGKSFDTSNVTNMFAMFLNAGTSSKVFTLDLGDKFDTSNVTDMSYMFWYTGEHNTSFTLDLGDKFDTSKVTNMTEMFYGTGSTSSKLNFAITIKNPSVCFDWMFLNSALGEGSKITVNYTSDTSHLIDEMIATKSVDANVVKGVCVDCT